MHAIGCAGIRYLSLVPVAPRRFRVALRASCCYPLSGIDGLLFFCATG
jgi:hypothetical protein